MPKEMFLNLPKEKQNKILNAAKKEFTRELLPKALVSNIVRDAEISRGSFYNYFEDLEDLFIYLIKVFYDYSLKSFKCIYIENDKDLFISLKVHFDCIMRMLKEPNNKQFNQNVFASLAFLAFQNDEVYNFSSDYIFWIDYNYLDDPFINQLGDWKEEFIELTNMIRLVSLKRFLFKDVSLEDTIVKYNNYIDLLKNLKQLDDGEVQL